MQNRMKVGLAAATFAALSLVTLRGGGMLSAAAQTDSFSEGQVKSIEKIVKELPFEPSRIHGGDF